MKRLKWRKKKRLTEETLRSLKIENLKIRVNISVGNVFRAEQEIHNEESFCVEIMRAIRNGKDPIDALSLLAYIGSQEMNNGDYVNSVKYRIGP